MAPPKRKILPAYQVKRAALAHRAWPRINTHGGRNPGIIFSVLFGLPMGTYIFTASMLYPPRVMDAMKLLPWSFYYSGPVAIVGSGKNCLLFLRPGKRPQHLPTPRPDSRLTSVCRGDRGEQWPARLGNSGNNVYSASVNFVGEIISARLAIRGISYRLFEIKPCHHQDGPKNNHDGKSGPSRLPVMPLKFAPWKMTASPWRPSVAPDINW